MALILKSGGTWIAGVVDMAGVMGGSDKGCLDLRSLNTVLLLGASVSMYVQKKNNINTFQNCSLG